MKASCPDYLECLLEFSEKFQFLWEIANKYDKKFKQKLHWLCTRKSGGCLQDKGISSRQNCIEWKIACKYATTVSVVLL